MATQVERIRAETAHANRAALRTGAFTALPPQRRLVARGRYAGRELTDLRQDDRGLTFLLDNERKWIVNPPVLVADPGGDVQVVRMERPRPGRPSVPVAHMHRYDPEEALRQIVEQLGSTTVVFSGTGDGWVEASSAVYLTARLGAGFTVATADTFSLIGQSFFTPTYYIDQCYFGFDASAITDTDTISASVLSLYGNADNTTTNCKLQVGALDWSGGGVTSADWQDGTELGAMTNLAEFDTAAAAFSTVAYNDFTEIAGGLAAATSKTGTTYLVAYSDRNKAGTTPTNSEYVQCWMADETGTTKDPKLTVTHTAAASDGGPAFIGGGFF